MDARRLAYLGALGIDTYLLRDSVPDDLPAPDTAPVVVAAPPAAVTAPAPAPARPARPAARPVAATPAAATPAASPAFQPAAGGHPAGGLAWEPLAAAVAGCRRCGLCETRTQTVFGVGNRQARWMVVGEAPGADEDRQGEPFVGRAGQLLNSMLRACGLAREDVFIANVLKCRPPGNRDPAPAEVAECLPYLMDQVALVNPQLILCVGRIAAQNLLGTDTPLAKLRGKVHAVGARQWPVIVTYHPAYLLRSPLEKRKAWDDLRMAMATVAPHGGSA